MFSIIIPCQKPSAYLKECLWHILAQEYFDPDETQGSHGVSFEIIVLPDENFTPPLPLLLGGGLKGGIKIIPTGSVLPGKKRNIGAKNASGKILAFIDDDAYPANDWLKNALKYFADENVTAIGGPGLTPPNDSFWQQVSGAMYVSWFSGANPERFCPIGQAREVDDWPSMNFFVRRAGFLKVGGFNERYWPGEDTLLCLKLNKLGKIVYAPDVVVYHHRRRNLKEHLKQAGQFGFMRGTLISQISPISQNSLKYFLPSLFTLFILFGWLLLFLPQPLNLISPFISLIYLISLIISLIQIYIKIKKTKVAMATLIYIPLTHFWYGWKFLRGLIVTENTENKKTQETPQNSKVFLCFLCFVCFL